MGTYENVRLRNGLNGTTSSVLKLQWSLVIEKGHIAKEHFYLI